MLPSLVKNHPYRSSHRKRKHYFIIVARWLIGNVAVLETSVSQY